MSWPATPDQPAVSRLRKRREYLAMRGGHRIVKPAFVLVSRPANDGEAAGSGRRFGFTVTKRIGNAVERNRIRRRLKEAVRLVCANASPARLDHVLIGRRGALGQDFRALVDDLAGSLDRAAAKAPNPSRSKK